MFRSLIASYKMPLFRYLLQNYTLNALKRDFCSKYWSNKKIIKPSTIAVSKGNRHLIINLFDQHDKNLGQMSMDEAKRVSLERELKLVMIDENQNPPKFKLMKGSELASIQMKKRAEAKSSVGNTSTKTTTTTATITEAHNKHSTDGKEIRITLKSDEHDVKFKIKNVRHLYESGNFIRVLINCRGNKFESSELEKLQKEFINKLKTNPDMPNFVVNAINSSEIILHVNKKIE